MRLRSAPTQVCFSKTVSFELRVMSRELLKASPFYSRLETRNSRLAPDPLAKGNPNARLKHKQIGAPRLQATHDSQLDERQRKT